jgi:hypothetical protein
LYWQKGFGIPSSIVLSPWSGLIADRESPAMRWRFAEDGHRGDAEATSRGIGSAKPKNA